MIGMMYLVLTALLALQIKDAVLEKFILIENGLAVSNQSLLDYNQRTLLDIKEDVVNQGDKEGDQAVALTAQNIRDYTTGLVAYIDDMKYQVGSASSGGDTSKVYERSTLKKYEEPSRYLYEQHFGDSLKAQLDAFPQQVNAAIDKLGKGGMNPEWMQSIAIDANDMKLYEDNQEEKNKSYSKFNFYKAPLASVLAQLTFYKNQVYAKESEALNKLKTLVGSAVTVKPADIEKLGSFDAVAPTPRAERPQVSNDNAAKNPQATPRASNNSTQTTEIKPEDFLQVGSAGIDYAQATLSESNQ